MSRDPRSKLTLRLDLGFVQLARRPPLDLLTCLAYTSPYGCAQGYRLFPGGPRDRCGRRFIAKEFVAGCSRSLRD